MADVIPGRFTAQADESFVVFLIGMRINRFFAFNCGADGPSDGAWCCACINIPEGVLGAARCCPGGVTPVQYRARSRT